LNDEILLNLSPSRTPPSLQSGNEVREASISGNRLNNNNNSNFSNGGRMCVSAGDGVGHNVDRTIGQNQNQTTSGNGHFDVAYSGPNNNNNNNNNGNGSASQRSWYHELVGCLRPVFSFVAKEKPISQSVAQGKTI
jgi:hypothetical protein